MRIRRYQRASKEGHNEWRTWGFKHEVDLLGIVVGLHSDSVVAASTLEHLHLLGHREREADIKHSRWRGGRMRMTTHHALDVEAHGDVAITAIVLKAVGVEEEGDKRHMAAVHRLKREACAAAVEVTICN